MAALVRCMDNRRPEILIVEDEPLVALSLEALVEELGYAVAATLPDAASAWESAQRSTPDIAIVDLNLLDGRTGLELAGRLAAQLGVTVIVATGNPGDVPDEGGPVFDVVRKPYLDEFMAAALDRALSADRARNRLAAIPTRAADGA